MSASFVLRWLLAALLVLLALPSPVNAQQAHDRPKPERPAALVPLYLSFAGLQALDLHSTLRAADGGAREANPIVRGTLNSPASLLIMKSATAAGVVLLTEKLWPHNRTAAVITMIALNSAYVTIAAHNYRAARRR